MAAEHLNEIGQRGIVQNALAGGGGVEIYGINHALELGILAGDGPHDVGQVLPQAGGPLADGLPAGFFGNVEANQVALLRRQFLCYLGTTELLRQARYLIVVDIREAL